MSDIKNIVEDYSHQQVPAEQAVSGLRIALVIIGFAITLPLMLTGSKLGLSLGLKQALIAFSVGGVLLMVLAVFTAIVGANARVSTYKIIEVPFGVVGAKLVNLVLATTLLGWYGVTAALFGEAVHRAFVDLYAIHGNIELYTVVGSLLMVAVTVFGFKALDKLSLIAVPLLIIFLFFMFYYSMQASSMQQLLGMPYEQTNIGVAISVVVGSYVVGATLVPDLCRYAKSARHGVAAVVVSLGLALPCILLVSAIPSLAMGNSDLVQIMMQLGLGVPALLMIVFATWTSNANNLYSTSLGLAAVFTKTPKWKITILAGLLCTLVAISGITEYFVPFLLTLGIAIPPIAGIYIADYFFVHGSSYYKNLHKAEPDAIGFSAFIAWGLSTLLAVCTANNWFSLSGIPSCDSLLSALLIYVTIERLKTKPSAKHEYLS